MTSKPKEQWFIDLPCGPRAEKDNYFVIEARGNDMPVGYVRVALAGNKSDVLRKELSATKLRENIQGRILNQAARIEWREAPWQEVAPIAYALLKACLMAKDDSEEG